MEWLARSADNEKGQDVQSYARHIIGVLALVERFLQPLNGLLLPAFFNGLYDIVLPAALFHDLGKLDDCNQAVLRGEQKDRILPLVHSDAGVVELLGEERVVAALLVASHHNGLPNLVEELNRGEDFFRVKDSSRRMKGPLNVLISRHKEALKNKTCSPIVFLPEVKNNSFSSAYLRIALSLLVDADHTDSSHPNIPIADFNERHLPCLNPKQRLAALDAYVSKLKVSSERGRLRSAIYEACRGHLAEEHIVACDSPVGSGKTTAVMAHLLSVAAKRKLRRIFVILPFTNIIMQSAKVYKEALILPGEKPDDIVAEVHHLADFDNEEARDYAVRWNAPIVITTAVAFFETLAAARPVALRRLHELVGSAVFLDEAHAALPAKYLPVAWRWIQTFADEWNVHWVLASGSLVHFWNIPEVLEPSGSSVVRSIPLLTSGSVRDNSNNYEKTRVKFETAAKPLSVDTLLDTVVTKPGPRLVVLNTVQNAAVVARFFRQSGRFSTVFHLSTALTPADRETILDAVKEQMNCNPDGNWVLVGTSCIEAGIDLDFASGFREMASLTSLLQCSGRVNRSGTRGNACMVSFYFDNDDRLNRNPVLDDSIRVLREMLDSGVAISAEACTKALQRELRLNPGADSMLSKICKAEDNRDFPEVEKKFHIIDADTRTVLIDEEMIHRIEAFESVDWRSIQRKSVQIWGYKIDALRIPELDHFPGIYKWHLNYSSFLGIMEGILENDDFQRNGGGVI